MKGPRHLWTGDWRSASQDNEESLGAHAPLRAPVEDPLAEPETIRLPDGDEPAGGSGTQSRVRGRKLRAAPAAIVLVIAVGALAFFFGNSLIGGSSDDSNQTAKTPNALPSVDSQPLKPRKGQTIAGAIYEKASPAVVSIRTSGGSGTGFLVDANGTIVTNDHVVESGSRGGRITVRFGRDGGRIDGDLLGTDPSSDLAVISIPKADIPKGVKPLQFADSRNVRVGDMVLAIGNPFDLDRTATEGIVSALERDIEAPNHYTINNVIQTDAPINPGNSGGPLLDDSAHVVGVNSQIATAGSEGNVGIGFAVPSNTVRQVIPILKKGGSVKRAYLGVETGPPASGTGAQISSLVASGPSQRAGLRVGDVIKTFNGKPVTDPTQLSILVTEKQPGDTVPVRISRNGVTSTVQVTLGTRPASTSSP